MPKSTTKKTLATKSSRKNIKKQNVLRKLSLIYVKNRALMVAIVVLLLVGGGYAIYRAFAATQVTQWGNESAYTAADSEMKLSGDNGTYQSWVKTVEKIDGQNITAYKFSDITKVDRDPDYIANFEFERPIIFKSKSGTPIEQLMVCVYADDRIEGDTFNRNPSGIEMSMSTKYTKNNYLDIGESENSDESYFVHLDRVHGYQKNCFSLAQEVKTGDNSISYKYDYSKFYAGAVAGEAVKTKFKVQIRENYSGQTSRPLKVWKISTQVNTVKPIITKISPATGSYKVGVDGKITNSPGVEVYQSKRSYQRKYIPGPEAKGTFSTNTNGVVEYTTSVNDNAKLYDYYGRKTAYFNPDIEPNTRVALPKGVYDVTVCSEVKENGVQLFGEGVRSEISAYIYGLSDVNNPNDYKNRDYNFKTAGTNFQRLCTTKTKQNANHDLTGVELNAMSASGGATFRNVEVSWKPSK